MCICKHFENVKFYRYNGQRILYGLMSHEEFDKMMNKYVSATTLRNVKDKLEVLKKKVILPYWMHVQTHTHTHIHTHTHTQRERERERVIL